MTINKKQVIKLMKEIQKGTLEKAALKVGISQNSLTNLNLKCICKISDSNIINKAKRLNKTRAETAMINLAQEMNGVLMCTSV